MWPSCHHTPFIRIKGMKMPLDGKYPKCFRYPAEKADIKIFMGEIFGRETVVACAATRSYASGAGARPGRNKPRTNTDARRSFSKIRLDTPTERTLSFPTLSTCRQCGFFTARWVLKTHIFRPLPYSYSCPRRLTVVFFTSGSRKRATFPSYISEPRNRGRNRPHVRDETPTPNSATN